MKAFTLIEVLLSIALLTILTGIAIPFYSEYGRNNMGINSGLVVDSIRSAQLFSISGKEGSDWCVHFEQKKITVFKKAVFEQRDINHDKEMIVPELYNFSGINDICFNQNGFPDKIGNVVMTGGSNSLEFSVNSKGVINQ